MNVTLQAPEGETNSKLQAFFTSKCDAYSRTEAECLDWTREPRLSQSERTLNVFVLCTWSLQLWAQ